MNLYLAIQAYKEIAVCCDDYGVDRSQVEEMHSIALTLAPSKPVRIVCEWLWIDFIPDQKLSKDLERMHLAPAFLCSLNVIHDDQKAIPAGGYVRTTLLKNISNNCIFETRNTSYVLVSIGERVKVTQNEAQNIFSLR